MERVEEPFIPADREDRLPDQPDGWFVPPSLDDATVARIAFEAYGICGQSTTLRGEREQNIRLSSSDGSFVLKIAGAGEDVETLDFQCRALEHIATSDPALPVPRLVRSLDDEMVVVVDVDGVRLPVRLLTFIPGRTFEDVPVISADGLGAIGAFQGRLAETLATFTHPAQHSFMPWGLDAGMLDNADVWATVAPDARTILDPCRERVAAAVAALSGLRRQVIHNDGHRGNLLRAATTATDGTTATDEAVTGIIDFGDLVTSARAADLGVSGASFVGAQPDPAAAFVAMVEGYHAVNPLDPDELTLLPELVLCRAVLSAIMTDYQMQHSPHIAGFVSAERAGILATVQRWTEVDAGAVAGRLSEIATASS